MTALNTGTNTTPKVIRFNTKTTTAEKHAGTAKAILYIPKTTLAMKNGTNTTIMGMRFITKTTRNKRVGQIMTVKEIRFIPKSAKSLNGMKMTAMGMRFITATMTSLNIGMNILSGKMAL